ncbi:hypothetical protein PVAND_015664 [Polypedilum vanderplanki]|uniref:Uncharacterized protein n=1 Tax=Polypedilum vanderplanki TaxID=319348 RepID=A0A9J6BCX6_POLVA|nr:hypothetical protein PVAND_015664 [Polypedilum vanderplanki]
MVKKSVQEPTIHEDREEIVYDNEEEEDEDEEQPKGSKIAQILQKPFDFISMMVQFIIYFMVRMATEGCMLPIPELEEGGAGENADNDEENDDDEEEEGNNGSKKKN